MEIIRKERSVGICPVQPTIYEVLEEVALTVQAQLVDSKLPFCAFNGGKDVFVDIGERVESLLKSQRAVSGALVISVW